jgi:hypothetical protein
MAPVMLRYSCSRAGPPRRERELLGMGLGQFNRVSTRWSPPGNEVVCLTTQTAHLIPTAIFGFSMRLMNHLS